MSNLAIDAALKASNFLNLINIHSKNVLDNIIWNSDLNGTIITGNTNVWNNFKYNWQVLQNNKYNTCYIHNYYNGDYSNDHYIDKLLVDYNVVLGIRVLINYRE